MRFKLKAETKPYDYTVNDPLPGCGHDIGVFTVESPYFERGYMWLPGRIIGWCNRVECDQRFYVYPASGRVTRRNTGETLRERRERLGHY